MNFVTVRMFTGKAGTVRWEGGAPGASGLAMTVRGPQSAVTSLECPDLASLAAHQSQAERDLLENGYRAYPLPERRGGDDRRFRPRRPDRRLAWRERDDATNAR